MTEIETDAPPRPPSRGHGTRDVWFAWVEAAYRPLHAAGLDDTRAAAMLGVSRMATSACRARLGLPHNDSPGRRSHGRAFGLRNVGRRVYDPAAYGLPAGLYAPQVRIVLALADGPRTAASLGTCPGLTYAEIRAGNNRAGVR